MTVNEKLVSAFAETLHRGRRIVAGTFALALLVPTAASAMDNAPKGTFGRESYLLPLPSIRYLDSMRWMDWKPSAPVFKVDTLLVPDSAQPGVFRLPSDYERGLPRVS
jgi:hypothetical protein